MGAGIDLDEIFRAHQKEIFVYCLRTVGERGVAEDLAQETFLRAFRSALTYRGEASVRTWLFRIARNTVADHFRRVAPERLGDADEQVFRPDPGLRLAVEESLGRLPVASREAIVLCDVLEFSPTEAAEAVGVTANAFRVRLHRARHQFREVHGDDY